MRRRTVEMNVGKLIVWLIVLGASAGSMQSVFV
jgi:hypothetical protein